MSRVPTLTCTHINHNHTPSLGCRFINKIRQLNAALQSGVDDSQEREPSSLSHTQVLLSLSRNTLAYILISFLANSALVLAYCKVIPGVALVRIWAVSVAIPSLVDPQGFSNSAEPNQYIRTLGVTLLSSRFLLDNLLSPGGQSQHCHIRLPLRLPRYVLQQKSLSNAYRVSPVSHIICIMQHKSQPAYTAGADAAGGNAGARVPASTRKTAAATSGPLRQRALWQPRA